ncbi:RIP metalloprotease RseP [marine bacterium AO1-C]|nr:RIP metalloprotease RseP [marine bacterium AO1-C]
MGTFIMIAQLLIGLSILVGLHELGHLLAAKMFGIKVEKFSIGFGPKIVGFKYKETEYVIAPIFLGGYVKIAGIIDESMDTEHLKAEPEPWEYRAKPAWQRLIVMMGGIIVNVITGIIVFICLTFFYGERYTPAQDLKDGIVVGPIGKEIGLKTGDKLIKVNGEKVQKFGEFRSKIITQRNSTYTVERDGKEITLKIPNNLLNKLVSMKAGNQLFLARSRYDVGAVEKGKGAAEAGIQKGDKIIAVNGQPTELFDQLSEVLKKNSGKKVEVTIEREGKTQEFKGVAVDTSGRLGFQVNSLLPEKRETFSLGASISKGTFDAFNVVVQQVQVFGRIFKSDASASKSLSGPIGIAKFFGTEWIAERFWRLVGLLSMVLAFMNFLPIPALDGGHVMFLTYEIVSGRPPADRFLIISQNIGMILLIGLMAFAIINDILKVI